MSTPDIRAAVDLALRRHLARAASPASPPPASTDASPPHPSHARFALPDGAASGGACVIQPAVTCIHSGHCQAQGY